MWFTDYDNTSACTNFQGDVRLNDYGWLPFETQR